MSKSRFRFKNVSVFNIVVIIVLTSVVMVLAYFALEPYEQSARARDKERISGVGRFSTALWVYSAQGETPYPPAYGEECEPESWAGCVLETKSLAFIPAPVEYKYREACSTNPQGSWCYGVGQDYVIVFTSLESKAERAKCNRYEGKSPYFVWTSDGNRTGTVCTDGTDPTPDDINFIY